MARTLKSAKALSRLLKDKEQQERARLATIDQKLDELRLAERQITASFGDESKLAGLFIDILATRLRNLCKSIGTVEVERENLRLGVQDAVVRARRAEDFLATTAQEKERRDQHKELTSLLDAATAYKTQGRSKSPRA